MSWRRKDRQPLRRRARHAEEGSGVGLDEGFVREAPVVELSAEQRAAERRRAALDWQTDEGTREAARAFRLARRAKRRRRGAAVLAIVVVVSLLGSRAVQRDEPASSSPHGAIDPGPDRVVHGELIDLPPPSSEQARTPLGRPAPRAAESDRYRFAWTRPGSDAPVAYDPCRPIHVVVNNRTAPPGADVLLAAALEAVRRATGLVFVVDGPTDEAPNPKRPPYQPDRYPKRWAPVLVAWSDPVEAPTLAGAVAGSGGSMALSVGDDRLYVTGGVTLDGPQLRTVLGERGGKAEVRAVLEHELGHLVGLDHVPDPTQLMNPDRVRGRVSFGAGDLTGLALLGQGSCFPTI